MTNTKISMERAKRTAEILELNKTLETITDARLRWSIETRIRNHQRRITQLDEIQDWEARRWELIKLFSSALLQGDGEITPAEIAEVAVKTAESVIIKTKDTFKF